MSYQLPNFPVDALPDRLKDFVQNAAAALNCPVDFLGVFSLAVMSAAIGTSRIIRIKEGWEAPPVIYSAVVAPPASKKSPAFNLSLKPVRRKQLEFKAEKKAEVERRLAELNANTTEEKTIPVKEEANNESGFIALKSTDKPAFIAAVEFIADWATSKAIVFLTLLGALAIQVVHHVAHLVNSISSNDNLMLGYVFGSVSELTALMLTVHQARKSMLIIFAFIQCWINVLYYCQLPELTVKLTLSALIAFVIFSYSELYTNEKKQKIVHAPRK